MNNESNKIRKIRRQTRIRSKIRGTQDRPRLSVYRSNRLIYAQVINDDEGKTIIGVSEKELGKEKAMKTVDRAKALGLLLAKKCKEKKIAKVVFDKGSYLYHGNIKALADGAREGGLKF